MPRLSRIVFAGLPHHITQRGNRREDVFFSNADKEAYLEWLQSYCEQHGVKILAYCLMINHIHLIAVPHAADGLQKVFVKKGRENGVKSCNTTFYCSSYFELR